jgi:hypothetical protein
LTVLPDDVDAATERLYRQVLESPLHGPFVRRVDALRAEPALPSWSRDAVLAVVPGASYRENPDSGADGRLVREEAERMGCPTVLAPLDTTGTLERNARILRAWLAAWTGGPLILVSLSKGGADVKAALSDPVFRKVVAWVNLCGPLNGTPMADWLLSAHPLAVAVRLYHRLRGQSPAFLEDLRYPAKSPLRLPEHLRLISVVGFPLRRHLTRRVSRRCHARLAPLGPNDGALVLADVCALPGLLYPVWGADHYLQPEGGAGVLVRAILRYLDETLD